MVSWWWNTEYSSPGRSLAGPFLLLDLLSFIWCVWQPHGLQHARLPCPSLSPGVCSNYVHWDDDAIQPFHPLLPPSPLPSVFLMTWLFTSSGQSIRASVSVSVLPMNIQDWFPLGLSGLTSLHSKGLSRVFSSTKNLQMYKLDLEKAEEPEIKLPAFVGS